MQELFLVQIEGCKILGLNNILDLDDEVKRPRKNFCYQKLKVVLKKTFSLSTWIQLLGKDPKSWDTIYIEGKNPEPVN